MNKNLRWIRDKITFVFNNEKEFIDRFFECYNVDDLLDIKLADMIDNLPSIIEHDPGFAKVYVKEKTELLNTLTKGDDRLWILASHIIYRFNGE